MNRPLKIAIVTNVIASYREDFYDKLFGYFGSALRIFCQQNIPGMNLKTVDSKYGDGVTIVRSFVAKKERIGFQLVPVFSLLQYDIIFIYGNPRIVSNILYAFFLRLMGRKVVIWGQAKSAGSSMLLLKLRLFWWKFFNYIFLYTDDETDWLRDRGFSNQHISAMNNGLNQREIDCITHQWPLKRLSKWRQDNEFVDKPILLSCSRLTEKNQFDLVIKALYFLKSKGFKAFWVVIGDGEQKSYLENLSKGLGVEDQILWCGAIYKENELAPFFLSADFFMHPGAIGLSLQHAMGYGLPVLTHNRTDLHMPEFAAFKDGLTGLTFEHGSYLDLAIKIQSVLDMVAEKTRMGEISKRIAQTTYNTDVMTRRFIKMVEKIAGT